MLRAEIRGGGTYRAETRGILGHDYAARLCRAEESHANFSTANIAPSLSPPPTPSPRRSRGIIGRYGFAWSSADETRKEEIDEARTRALRYTHARTHVSARISYVILRGIACFDNAAGNGILWSRTFSPVSGSSFQRRYLRVCIYVKVAAHAPCAPTRWLRHRRSVTRYRRF